MSPPFPAMTSAHASRSGEGSTSSWQDVQEELNRRLASIDAKLDMLTDNMSVNGDVVHVVTKAMSDRGDTVHVVEELNIPGAMPTEESLIVACENDVQKPSVSKGSSAIDKKSNTLNTTGTMEDGEQENGLFRPTSERAMLGWAGVQNRRRSYVDRIKTSVRRQTTSCRCMDAVLTKAEVGIEEVRRRPKSSMYQKVHGMTFEALSSSVIMLHASLVGAGASLYMTYQASGGTEPKWVDTFEIIFCVFFSIELVIRLIAEQLLFFVGENWTWNLLDVNLVCLSLIDVVINGMEAGPVGVVTIGRMLRLTRFIRLARLSRVMKHCHNLRVVLFAIFQSLSSLVWVFAVISFIIYVVAVFFMYGVAEHFRAAGPDANDEISKMLRKEYVNISYVMSRLFMSVSGGVDWREIFEQWWDVSPVYGMLFYAYIFSMMFGVLNVVMATFVTVTQRIAAKDREQLIKTEMTKMEDYMKRSMEFFQEADSDGSGALSWEEFKEHMEKTHVKAYFQALELDVSQAHNLFEMLDTDGNNSVGINEFVEGCMRLRGGARNVDVSLVLLQCKKLTDQVASIHRKTARSVEMMSRLAASFPELNNKSSIGTGKKIQHLTVKVADRSA